MARISTPTSLTVSSNTTTLFTANGHSILWDPSGVQFVCLSYDGNTPLVDNNVRVAFEGEEIEDIATFDDKVFVLTKRSLGGLWSRPWKRRSGPKFLGDPYYIEQHLFTYTVRIFSTDGKIQIGNPLYLQQEGVDGIIRAGPNRIIVRVIGQECIASIWLSPSDDRVDWVPIYSELTWDPDIIAKQNGFEDAQAELDHLMSTTKRDSNPADITQHFDDRDDFDDDEILDYAFLSDTHIVRLRETAYSTYDLDIWLEVVEITVPSELERRPAPPILLKVVLPWYWSHAELSDSYLGTEPTFSEHRCLSVRIHNSALPI
ncbi:hypothetical protein DFH09DRAFT_1355160 [Mycena vulgaris]|nr:hypothetical protein DFH09DRAFT_1355160 [Mycena vulgaris]